MKRRMKKVLAILLVFILCISTTNMNAFASGDNLLEQLQLEETISTGDSVSAGNSVSIGDSVSTGDSEIYSDDMDTEIVFETESYKVTFTLGGCWDNGYVTYVNIQNVGDSVIENWCLTFDIDNEISDIWNAEISSQENGKYVVENVDWNADILVGESIQFGFSGNENFKALPSECELVGETISINEADYTFEYRIDGDWDNGFTGTVTITNNTDAVIEDWSVEFDFDNEISSIWNGIIYSHDEIHYVIHNAKYNQNIQPSASVSFGFTVDNGDSSYTISNIQLSEISTEVEKEQESDITNDIGEAYFKAPEQEDIILNEETGIVYIKDQILVSALIGVPREIIEQIADEIGAEIVGYIELTNDYQLEFYEPKTAEELDNIVNYLNGFSYISYASLNTAFHVGNDKTTTDDLEYHGDVWNELAPRAKNWGLEALKIPSAWDYRNNFQPVKVGLIDDMFDKNHEDLQEQFRVAFNNPETITSGHGTHVAGIMAATWNNGKGIAGVVTNRELYAYAKEGAKDDMTTIMEYKYALALLIGNQVRVINISLNTGELENFAASCGNEKAIRYVETNAAILEEFLGKLILSGYDFVLVVAAGNVQDDLFVVDNNSEYGYSKVKLHDNLPNTYVDKNEKIYFSNNLIKDKILAYYNNFFAAIDAQIVKSRIIVVGAIDYEIDAGRTVYKYTEYSNVGERVDVCAPGENIWSCVPKNIKSNGYDYKGGTSMAAPYIAGIAGMLYQANPDLDATQVKNIICNNIGTTVTDNYNNSYGMPDALLCVQEALSKIGGNSDAILPSGIIVGKVVQVENEPVSGVKITACRTSVGESNLSDYYTIANTDVDGNYEIILTQGTYDLYVYAPGYVPLMISDVIINPDETIYWENIVLYSWGAMDSIYSDISGVVADALNGAYVNGATVKLREGWNKISGEYVTDILGNDRIATTNVNGEYSFSLPMGAYTAEISKDGYITGYCNIIAKTELAAIEQRFVLTPILSDDEYRIILTWGEIPRDLDSHLTYYVNSVQQMHVYCNNKVGKLNGEIIASLDLDDGISYGPETVTINLDSTLLENGIFKYSVLKFSGYSDFAEADAVVRVYKGNTLLKTYNVPENRSENVWHVFDIDKTGITTYNEFYTASSALVR